VNTAVDTVPEPQDHKPPVVRDKRRIDPTTGGLRPEVNPDSGQVATGTGQTDTAAGTGQTDTAAGTGQTGTAAGTTAGPAAPSPESAHAQLAERTADLQRLQAEYANYRKRVERDRDAVRELAVIGVLTGLLPVLDDIARARQHGEVVGGFKVVAESLEATLNKLGLQAFGAEGEPFDPNIHEALMHEYSAEVSEATCVAVLQPGYRVGERIVRPVRVKVAEPEPIGSPSSAGATDSEFASASSSASGPDFDKNSSTNSREESR
jgi:molecular chaperone GrpE